MSVWFQSCLNPWYIWIPSNPNLYSTKIIMKMRWQTIASNVSIRTISPTATPLPKTYDCVAVYIAGRRTSLVVYGWWPQPPTKKAWPVTLADIGVDRFPEVCKPKAGPWVTLGNISIQQKNMNECMYYALKFLQPTGIKTLGVRARYVVSKLTIIDSDNGLLSDMRQAIIWINTRILLIGPLEQTSVKS